MVSRWGDSSQYFVFSPVRGLFFVIGRSWRALPDKACVLRLLYRCTPVGRCFFVFFLFNPRCGLGCGADSPFYRPCAALRLLKTCLQIGVTLCEGITNHRLFGLRPHEVAHARHSQVNLPLLSLNRNFSRLVIFVSAKLLQAARLST